MFIDKLSTQEKEKLAKIVISTYNTSGYSKVPDYADINLDETINISWSKESFLMGYEKFVIDILDFGVFFGGLSESEAVEKKCFQFLDKKFPEYAKCYFNEYKEGIDEEYMENINELKSKIKKFKRNFDLEQGK